MTPTHSHNQSGYIALVSVIIMSAVLLVLIVSVSGTSVLNRVNVLTYQYKEASRGLADGCVDAAFLKLINDSNYSPSNESVLLGSHSCTIVSVTPSAGQKVIQVQGVYPKTGNGRSYTNLQVRVTVSTGSLVVHSWEEVAHF